MNATGKRKFIDELEILIRARYSLIGIQTWEEERVTNILLKLSKRLEKQIFGWSVIRGLTSLDPNEKFTPGISSREPLKMLQNIYDFVDPAIFVLFDFHSYLKDASIIRAVREIGKAFKSSLKTLVFVSPGFQIPTELEKEITMMQLDLPDAQDIDELLDGILSKLANRKELAVSLNPDVRERLIQSTMGLTLMEAENVLAKAIVSYRSLNEQTLELIVAEKEQIIRRSGVLEFYSRTESFDNIGGLHYLKDWLRKRRKSFSSRARAFGLPAPKGILLVGVQGCGKSMVAKAVADYWAMPLLRLDVGSLFSSLIGSTEENLRRALAVSESVAPAILWIDEIEKAFAGLASSGKLDAGVSARVFGSLITWLQEKTTPVFVIATSNDISQLPPEMLRKGRFDEIFFVDLPVAEERTQIFRIHLSRRGFNPEDFDIEHLVEVSDGFSGAEIESGIVSAMFDAFDVERPLDTEKIERALKETVPLSLLMEDKITMLRKWAEKRVRKAS